MQNYPQSILQHRTTTMLKKAWDEIYLKNRMFCLAITGKTGSGKSWAALELADKLDRDKNDNPRFDVSERCIFSAIEFARLVKRKLPKGSAIVLDDAGLFMYSADALTREVKELCKIFQSIRSSNYCLIWTLPYFSMLAVNIRRIMDYYGEMISIDRLKQQSIMKFHRLETSSITGDIYHFNMTYEIEQINPSTGVSTIVTVKTPFIRIDKPRFDLVATYEKKKEEQKLAFYAGSEERMVKQKKKKEKKKPVFLRIFETVTNNIDEYTVNGKVDSMKILFRNECALNVAEKIASVLNKEAKRTVEGG